MNNIKQGGKKSKMWPRLVRFFDKVKKFKQRSKESKGGGHTDLGEEFSTRRSSKILKNWNKDILKAQKLS